MVRKRLSETASEEEHLIVLDKLTSKMLLTHNFHDIEDAITNSSAKYQETEDPTLGALMSDVAALIRHDEEFTLHGLDHLPLDHELLLIDDDRDL